MIQTQRHQDPVMDGAGHAGIDAMVQQTQQFPDFRFREHYLLQLDYFMFMGVA